MQTKQSIITVHPKVVIKVLSAIAIFLALTNVFTNFVKYVRGDRIFYGLIPLFQLSAENGIPAFFFGCLSLLNAVLLLLIWQARRTNAEPQIIWVFLAGLFLLFAFNELFSVHEHLVKLVMRTLGISGLLYFAGGIISGMALLAYLFFQVWRRLNKRVKLWLALSAITYVSGAVAFAIVGSVHHLANGGEGDLIYGVLDTIEESLEMAGLIMFAYSLFLLLQREFDEVAIMIPDEKR